MDSANKFKCQTFALDGREYLYQLQIRGEDSLLVIYDTRSKLRCRQRINLPANCKVYLSENIILARTPTQILIFVLPNTTTKHVCHNPSSIKQIQHVCYNAEANLTFILDETNTLFYLLHETGNVDLKKLYSCSEHGHHGKITSLFVDTKQNVQILIGETSTLLTLKFDWNQRDKLMHQSVMNGIVAIYSRFLWDVCISKIEGNNDLLNMLVVFDGQKYSKSIQKFNSHSIPLIKATPSDFLFLNSQSRQIMLIYKQQQIANKIEQPLPFRLEGNQILFQVDKINFKTVNFKLHQFEGLREPFKTTTIPIQWIQVQPEQETLIYIHNNIHLMFDQKGLSPHFYNKVKEYLNGEDQDDEIMASKLFRKLFIRSPLTIRKLAEYLVSNEKNSYLFFSLSKYIQYIEYSLNQIKQVLRQILQKKQRKQMSEDEVNELGQYKQFQQQIKNMVSFMSAIQYAVRKQQMFNFDSFSQMDDQGTFNFNKYKRCLDKCKIFYLLNDIIVKPQGGFKNIQGVSVVESYQQNKMQEEKQLFQDDEDEQLKIGKNTCHQLFSNQLSKNPSLPQIFQYLRLCQNFNHAAYFYLWLNPSYDTVPYITDTETVQLIRFLASSSIGKIISKRQRIRQVTKVLPKYAGKALLINDCCFLQFICGLSINCKQQKSAIAIIVSGVAKTWPRDTHDFVLQSLIICDRVLLAYDQIQILTQNSQDRQVYLQKLTQYCIQSKRVKDLLQVSSDSQEVQYIKDRLSQVFGEDIQEVVNLMSQLEQSSYN